MKISKPTGKYVDQMIGPDGWPGIDEQVLIDRGFQLIGILQQLTGVLEKWQNKGLF
jgi:hypothetical protein